MAFANNERRQTEWRFQKILCRSLQNFKSLRYLAVPVKRIPGLSPISISLSILKVGLVEFHEKETAGRSKNVLGWLGDNSVYRDQYELGFPNPFLPFSPLLKVFLNL